MSACEKCWTEASRRARIQGGSTADHYRDVLAEHDAIGDHEPDRDFVAEAAEVRKQARG